MDSTLVERKGAKFLSMHKKRSYHFFSRSVKRMFSRVPDATCYFCDGKKCKIKRILDRPALGQYCLMGDSGGKEECRLFNNTQNEGLILFFK